MTNLPILSASPAGAQTRSAVRDFLKVVGTAYATKGVMQGDHIAIAVGGCMVLGPVAWSQADAILKQRRMEALAAAKPAEIIRK